MTHLKLFTRAFPRELAFNRYWKIAEETLDRPEKTTIPRMSAYVFADAEGASLTSQEDLPRFEIKQIEHIAKDTDKNPV